MFTSAVVSEQKLDAASIPFYTIGRGVFQCTKSQVNYIYIYIHTIPIPREGNSHFRIATGMSYQLYVNLSLQISLSELKKYKNKTRASSA